ncbi:hypothetical protein ABNF65_22230 [Paenibacillus larvae]
MDETIIIEVILYFGEKNRNRKTEKVVSRQETSSSNRMNGAVQNKVTETTVQALNFKCRPPENFLIVANPIRAINEL